MTTTEEEAPPRAGSRRQLLAMAVALAVTIPGVAARLAGVHFPDPLLALIFGGAIVGPSARSRPEDDSR